MLRNYFVIAVRNLLRSPGLSSIKIVGLSIGVCGCIIVFLLARLELSFDKHHTKGENVYRVYSEFTGVWQGINYGVPLPFPPALRDRATGLEAISQVITNDYNVVIREGSSEKKFPKPNKTAFVDDNYFKVFPDFKWIVGTPDVLLNPGNVVITESKAKTYFATNDVSSVVGKSVFYRDSLEVTVAGVIADPVHNTDFNFTDFISLPTTQVGWMKKENNFEEWGDINSAWMCFIRTSDGTDIVKIGDLLETMAREKDDKEADQHQVTTLTHFKLQPLSDIHFNSEIGTWDNGRPGTSLNTIQAMVGIAILLLLVAVINFVNLKTAQALRRAKEVGLRKAMGGTRASLIAFFIAESFVITFIAVALALPLAKLGMIMFSEFLPKDLSLDLMDPLVWIFVGGLTTVVAFISGIYPAFVLSSYQPVVALKTSQAADRSGNAFLRKILTVFQFTFSQALIAGAMIIGLQISWLLNKDLGFRRDAVVTVNPPWWEDNSKLRVFRNQLEQMSIVEMITQNSQPPASNNYSSTTLIYNNGKEDIPFSSSVVRGDTSYVRLFGLQLIAGRNVIPVDSLGEILVNETYCAKIGVAPIDMIGKDLKRGSGAQYHVVGVLKDFHHASLKTALEPWYFHYKENGSLLSVRLAKDADLTKAIDQIKEAGKVVYGETPVDITFMDETVQKYYESERRIAKLANTATALAIFISCLGLLGLASFTTIQRTKEIGIRKVLGASVTNIVTLLTREFILLVVISLIAAVPIAWYAGNQWLDTFPYRMEIGIWIFVVAGSISILVALITVGFQAIKAAIVNPVNSLRYE